MFGRKLAKKAYNNGLVRFNQQHYPTALSSFDQAFATKSDFIAAYTNRATTRHELKDFPQAQATYNQALKLEPGSYANYFSRAHAQEAQHHREPG